MAELGLGFPLILGGHDHSVFVGKYGPDMCKILKGGSDAHNAIIIDITWLTQECTTPLVKWELVEAKWWRPDRGLEELCKTHLSILSDLEHTVLKEIFQSMEGLSSEEMRSKQGCKSTKNILAKTHSMPVTNMML